MAPLITVVTVTFNAEKYLEDTIQSVVGQDYEQLEYIIIDGGSTDGTIDIIKRYEEQIAFWISESDEGIYDAMNKAVRYANGVFVNFMNAGDMFYAHDVVSRMVKEADPDAGLIYGDTLFYTEDGSEELVKAKEVDELWKAMIFNHNGLFARKTLLEKFPFDTFYKIVADSKFVIQCYLDGKTFSYVNTTVNRYLNGGFSDESSIMRTVERWKLVSDYRLKSQKEINDYYFQRLMHEPFYNERYMRKPSKVSSKQALSRYAAKIAGGNKKILIYSPIPIFPAVQGARIRIAMLSRALKEKGYELFLIQFGSDWVDPQRYDPAAVEREYNELFTKVIRIPKQKDHSKLMRRNIDIDDAYESHVGTTIKKMMEEHDIKVILMNYIFQSKALEMLPEDTVKIIDTHDKFTDKYKISTWYSYNAENEGIGISRADIVLAIQDNEKSYFESITEKRVVTIGHMTKKQFIDKQYAHLNTLGIISSGHDADLTAVEKFINLFLKSNTHGLKLKICGMVCDKLADTYIDPSIEYMFLVDDLKDFYSGIDLCIIPPEGGTGLKIKSIEALSFGVPIVSTKHGFEGVGSLSRFHNAEDINALFALIEEISNGDGALRQLEQECKALYVNYAEGIEKNLGMIFPQVKASKSNDLLDAIHGLCSVSVFRNPFAKYRQYKNTIQTFHRIKDNA